MRTKPARGHEGALTRGLPEDRSQATAGGPQLSKGSSVTRAMSDSARSGGRTANGIGRAGVATTAGGTLKCAANEQIAQPPDLGRAGRRSSSRAGQQLASLAGLTAVAEQHDPSIATDPRVWPGTTTFNQNAWNKSSTRWPGRQRMNQHSNADRPAGGV